MKHKLHLDHLSKETTPNIELNFKKKELIGIHHKIGMAEVNAAFF